MSDAGKGKQPRHLRWAVAASLVLLVVMLLPIGGLVRNIALVPLVLVLPGYAISVAMFGPGTVSRGERLVYTLALSVAAAALGGLLWQLFFELDRFAWAFLMVATVLVASRVARRRRLSRPSRPGGRSFRLGLPTALAMLASLALAVVAVDTAVEGLQDQRAEAHFSSLWVVPAGPSGDSVEIGVWNHQGAVHTYLLSVERDGATLWRWEGRLGSQQREQVALDPAQIAGSGELRVSLYLDGALYLRTELETGVGA